MKPAKIIIIAALALYFANAYSQDKFTVGIEGGPSLIFFHGKNHVDESYEPTTGYAGGLSFQSGFSENISLGMDVLYERKGSVMQIKHTYINGVSAPDTTVHINADYITLPLMGHISFGKKMHFYINLGPYFGFLVQGTSRKQTFNPATNTEQNYTNRLQNFDVGMTGGFGIRIPLREDLAFSSELRHNLGVHNLVRTHPDASESMKTSSTNFLVGIVYTLIK